MNNISEALRACREKLLDLSSRNRLLNFTFTKGKSLQFVHTDAQGLVRKIFEQGAAFTIKISPLPEPAQKDMETRAGVLQKPEPTAWAASQKISSSYDQKWLGLFEQMDPDR